MAYENVVTRQGYGLNAIDYSMVTLFVYKQCNHFFMGMKKNKVLCVFFDSSPSCG